MKRLFAVLLFFTCNLMFSANPEVVTVANPDALPRCAEKTLENLNKPQKCPFCNALVPTAHRTEINFLDTGYRMPIVRKISALSDHIKNHHSEELIARNHTL